MQTSLRKIVNVERLSLISSEPFETVLARLEAAVGLPPIAAFYQEVATAKTFAELEKIVQRALGRTGLMMFHKLDHGGILQKESGQTAPKMMRYLIGNPLIMKEMAKHAPDAGSYAPVTILVDERADGVHLSYDRMTSFLAPYRSAEASKVAQSLDKKIKSLLTEAAFGTGRRNGKTNDIEMKKERI